MSELEHDLNQQLAEIELLLSMFPAELQILNPDVLEERRNAIDQQSKICSLQESLDLLLKLDFPSLNDYIELTINLSPLYPLDQAVVFLRSQRLSSAQHRLLSEAITQSLADTPVDQLPVVQLIDWLRECFENFVTPESEVGQCVASASSSLKKDGTIRFARLWIYSHHIYNMEKRKNIVNWARDLSLTGFSKPGKPGVVCVEGDSSQTTDFWSRLRRLNWQRLSLKETEETEISDASGSIEDLRIFPNFEEKSFVDGNCSNSGKFNNMDLGQFFQWLQEKKCGDIFQVLFGIEGQLPKNAAN